MSWDDHISAMQKSGADDCCICDQNGNIWVKSAGFKNITQQEIMTVVKAAKDEPILDGEKLEIDGVPLMKVSPLDGIHTGCKLIAKNPGEKDFYCVTLSSVGVVIVKKGGPNQREAVKICEKEVDHLKANGY